LNRNKIMVIGANGALGRAVMQRLGSDAAIAVTRAGRSVPAGFEHINLSADGIPPLDELAKCRAVINAAGLVTGDVSSIEAANIQLPAAIANAAKSVGVAKFLQVSSFSIYGNVELIDASTPENPTSDYGRSKALGDAAVLALADRSFDVESLRLPFMFSPQKAGLLSPLITMALTLGFLPDVSQRAVARSMMTYDDAASTLVECARNKKSGISLAADPQLFDYQLLKLVVRHATDRNIRIAALPKSVADAIVTILPAIGRRLFRSSILHNGINCAGSQPLGLEKALHELALVSGKIRK
jgi:nucleoside-diphosphate-sugar epimerase